MLAISFYSRGKEVWGKVSDVTKVRQEYKTLHLVPALHPALFLAAKYLKAMPGGIRSFGSACFPSAHLLGMLQDHGITRARAAHPSCKIWAEQ